MNPKTSTKALALIIIFTALTIALNVYGPKIPYPFAPFLYFQFWEIPIVVAFLLIGPRTGIAVSAINTLILFAVFPGELPTGPLYNLAAVLAMLLGIYLPYRLATHNCKTENLSSYLRKHAILITISAAAIGATLRVLLMTVVNYYALQQTYPIGLGLKEPAVLAFLPFGGLFNAIIAAYTIPISIAIAIAIASRAKIHK
jgi:riboflavin transporter FmnP